MLDILRKFKRSIMGLFVLAFIIMSLAVFGLNGPNKYSRGRQQTETPALVINGTEVPHHEYSEQIRSLDSMGRRQFGANYDKIKGMLNVPGRVVDNLISQNLFYGLISDLGLDAGVNQVREYILQTYFPNGFNEELYVNMLRQSGVTEEQHQDKVRKLIAANQLQDLLSDISFVSEPELKAKYREENSKLTFQYLALKPADFESKVNLADEAALKKYYDEHKSEFKKGKSVEYTVVEFPIDEYAAKVDVTNDDLDEAYEINTKQFTEPRQVLLKRIAFAKEKVAPSSLEEMMDPEKKVEAPGNEAKKKAAEAALKRLKDGEDFEKVRGETTENVTGAGAVAEGAWVTVSSLEPKLKPAAQKLQRGEFSSVIETDAGFFIIRIEDLKPQRVKPLDEVKAEVEGIVRKNLAPTYAIASAENFMNDWEKKSKESETKLADFAATAGKAGVSTDRLFFEGEAPAGLPVGITAKAFSLGGGSRETVTVEGRVFVIDVEEVKPPFVPEFDQVKTGVETSYKSAKAKELAIAEAQAVIDEAAAMQLGAGISRLAPAAKKHGIEPKESQPKTRAEANGSEPFESADLVEAAFGLSDAQPLLKTPAEGGQLVYVYELSSRTLPDEGEWAKKRPELIKAEMQRGGQALAQSLLGNLKRHATIVDNTKAEREAAGGMPLDPIEH